MKFDIEKSLTKGLNLYFKNSEGFGCIWFSAPPDSIDGVDINYLREKGFWNITTDFEVKYIKIKYKKLITEFKFHDMNDCYDNLIRTFTENEINCNGFCDNCNFKNIIIKDINLCEMLKIASVMRFN